MKLRIRILRILHTGVHRSFFTASTNSVSSQKFDIRVSAPSHPRVPAPEGVAVLLLGNAGATFRQLERHSELYNSLGFRTLACTLPLQFVFHYDIPNTVRFCKQWTGVEIAGVVLDSAPGPATLVMNNTTATLERVDETLTRPGPGPWPPSRTFLVGAYCAVNWARGRSLREILSLGAAQLRQLDTRPEVVSWAGYWVKHEDRGGWPLMFVYSERDPLVPWRFVSSVAAETRRRGRRVEEWRLQDTGHVNHFKRHPEEYRDRVAAFLASCLKL